MGRHHSAPRRATHRRVRVYDSLRSAHLERMRELQPATIVYRAENYDFEPALTVGLDLVRVSGLRQLVGVLVRSDVRELEINEPLMLSAMKSSLVSVATVRAVGTVRGRRVRVATYAIENARVLSSASRRLRTPLRRLAYAVAARVVLGQVDRIVFGTPAAREVYLEVTPRPRSSGTLIPAISVACGCVESAEQPRSPVLLFLGTLDHRKGVAHVLDVWPRAAAAVPGARLVIVGQGSLEDRARDLATSREDVTLVIDPPREEVHARLRQARALVLWSQPADTWREQVGLPLVEGLAHGCEVIASDETGIAPWLTEHGHRVVPVSEGEAALLEAVVGALRSTRRPAQIRADLPGEDGRLAADRWMWSG